MQVSIETTSGLERRMTIGVPATQVESEVDSRLQRAAKQARINGFRPGKVPMKVVRQRFGAGVRQEVLGEVMSQSFYEAVQKENLKPAGRPSIEPKQLDEGRDVEFVATFEVFPEIELKDYSTIEVRKPVAEVTAQDVEKMIDVFRKQRGSWEAVERAAADGDQVNIDFVGTRDGEAFEGGSAEGSDLVLGSGRMIPGFEDGLVGLSAGEEKTLSLSFPEDYHNEDLRGAAVEFKVKVNTVQEQRPAALDDVFFAAYGVTEGGEEAFRQEVQQNMQRELKNATKNKVKNQIMDGLLAAHPGLQVPRALVSEEIGALRSQAVQQFGGLPKDFDVSQLLPDDMFQERAERRVKLGLVLQTLVSERQIKADAERVRATVEDLASTYEEPQEVVNWYYSNPQQLQSVEALVVEDLVVEHLLEQARVTDTPCSYEEALAAEPAQDAED